MTVHLDRTEQPINEAARYRRVRYGFEDATIICDGTEGIGLIRLTRSKDGWYIHQIQMLPSHQGQGIGREVICAVLAEATQVGLPVSLSVLRDNPALRLYERLGFHVISKTEFEFDMTCHPQS